MAAPMVRGMARMRGAARYGCSDGEGDGADERGVVTKGS